MCILYYDTLIDIAKLFVAYFITIIVLPAFMLKPRLKNKTITEKFMIYIVIGNIYVINVVFMIAYIGKLTRGPLLLILVGGAVVIRCILDCENLKVAYQRIYSVIEALLSGKYGWNLLIKNFKTFLHKKVRRNWKVYFQGKVVEGLLFLGVMFVIVYFTSYQSLHYFSYAAPDEEVHLYWIQSLIAGDIFPAGVYPHGFHNVCSALIVLFQFKAVTVIQVMSTVSTVIIMIMLYILLKRTCRSSYTAIFAFAAFSICDLYSRYATARYQFSVPQEYAMILLYPMAIFLVQYLKKGKKEDLILFGLSLSLTLTIHFYVTIIAGVLCIAIGIVYIKQILKHIKSLFICGILSLIIALVPLSIGLLTGHGLEQSFRWAFRIIETGNMDKTEDNLKEEEVKKSEERKTFKQKLEHEVTKYMVHTMLIFYIFVGLILLWIMHGLLRIIIGKGKPQTKLQLSLGVYGCLLILLIMCRPLGLPTLMEAKRAGIFFAYVSPVFIAAPIEIIYELIEKNRTCRKIFPIFVVLGLAGGIFIIDKYHMLRSYDYFYYIQTKGSMITINKIMEEYEDFSWTVVSPVNERSIILNDGFHYELLDFLVEQEHWNQDTSLYIPTKYVFLFIEKMPIIRYGMEVEAGAEELSSRPAVSPEDARKDIIQYESLEKNYNYIYQRDVIMSKAYYWAEEYKKYFPKEMTVYYEDEEIVVYRIKQNEYALNNLAVDYGFNSQ